MNTRIIFRAFLCIVTMLFATYGISSTQTPYFEKHGSSESLEGSTDNWYGIWSDGGMDLDQDGYPDFVVGSPEDGPSNIGWNDRLGRVFAYSGVDGHVLWTYTGMPDEKRRVGLRVLMISDLNNDGISDVVTSSYQNPYRLGMVLALSGSDGSVIWRRYSEALNATFGHGLDGIADIDDDGVDDIVVGDFGIDANGNASGRVYLLSGNDGHFIWSDILNHPTYALPGGAANDQLGTSVSRLGGDVDGDGYEDIIAGAPQQPMHTYKSGYVVIISGKQGEEIARFQGDAAGDDYGNGVRGLGDLDGDGLPEFLIGATQQFDSSLPGYVQLWKTVGFNQYDLVCTLTGDLPGDAFGFASDLCGDVDEDGTNDFVVGAYRADHDSLQDAGMIRVFSGAGCMDGILDGTEILASMYGTNSHDLFGASVSRTGDMDLDGRADVIGGSHRWEAGGDGYIKLFTDLIPNAKPIADAGEDQTVDEGTEVILDGSGSSDPDDDLLTYEWIQVAGPTVDLLDAGDETTSFTAPWVDVSGATLTFQLIVFDSENYSNPDTVNVTVKNVNNIPVADAGDPQTVQEGSPVSLNGTGSYDPDGEPLTYWWEQISGTSVDLSDPTSPTPSFDAPFVGASGETLVFKLVVNDGIDDSIPDTVLVEVENINHAPVADAGLDQTVDEGVNVTLDGNASIDPDGDALYYLWVQTDGPTVNLSDPTSATPSFTAPDICCGDIAYLEFRLVVGDGIAESEPDWVTIGVRDTNAPPDCTLAKASQAYLWPPNHKMHAITIVGVTDPDDDDVSIVITGVTQDEPINGLGDGDTGPDAVIQEGTVLIRAERSGLGNGRVYRIAFVAMDGAGASCSGSVTLFVPISKKKPLQAVDDGQMYDSTHE